jgi:hypothetical protein
MDVQPLRVVWKIVKCVSCPATNYIRLDHLVSPTYMCTRCFEKHTTDKTKEEHN